MCMSCAHFHGGVCSGRVVGRHAHQKVTSSNPNTARAGRLICGILRAGDGDGTLFSSGSTMYSLCRSSPLSSSSSLHPLCFCRALEAGLALGLCLTLHFILLMLHFKSGIFSITIFVQSISAFT